MIEYLQTLLKNYHWNLTNHQFGISSDYENEYELIFEMCHNRTNAMCVQHFSFNKENGLNAYYIDDFEFDDNDLPNIHLISRLLEDDKSFEAFIKKEVRYMKLNKILIN